VTKLYSRAHHPRVRLRHTFEDAIGVVVLLLTNNNIVYTSYIKVNDEYYFIVYNIVSLSHVRFPNYIRMENTLSYYYVHIIDTTRTNSMKKKYYNF